MVSGLLEIRELGTCRVACCDCNSTLLHGDVMADVRALRASEGGTIAVGGITMIRSLIDHDLLDELILTIHPVLAGNGRRLMHGHDRIIRLELVEQEVTEKGNVIVVYRRRPRH